MSADNEQVLISIIYAQLNDTVAYNLSAGLAYGTPLPHSPSLSLPFSPFLPLTAPDHPSYLVFRIVSRRVLHLNQDTSVRARSFSNDPSPARTLKLSPLASSCSSKGPLSHSFGSMFLFGITTIIFILSTIFMVLGPGLMSQFDLLVIKMLDPSFDRIWSPHKITVASVIIAVITRLVVRFTPSFISPLVVE
jgi:hypothetical protein